MKILSAEYTNWCQHQHLVIDMDAPVFGFLGPNGSGKSNILAGLRFAWTGFLKKSQQDYVRRTSIGEPPANGSVKVTFLKDGIIGSIFRQVGKTAKRELVWDGVTFKKAADIDRILEDLLSCDKDALSNVVFLNQGEIGNMLFQTPALREAKLADMLLVSYMAGISDIVGQKKQELDRNIIDQGSVRDEAIEAHTFATDRNRIATQEFNETTDHTALITRLTRGLTSWKALLTGESEVDRAGGRINELKERESFLQRPAFPEPHTQEALEQMVRENSEYHLRNTRFLEMDARLKRLLESREKLTRLQTRQMELLPLSMERSDARDEKARLDLERSNLIAMRNWRTQKDDLEARLAKADPMIAAKEEEVEKLKTEAAEISLRGKELEAVIAKHRSLTDFIQSGVVSGQEHHTCPLCSSAIAPGTIERIHPLQDIKAASNATHEELTGLANRARSLGEQLSAGQRQLGAWMGERDNLKTNLAAMVQPEGLKPMAEIVEGIAAVEARLPALMEILGKPDPNNELQEIGRSITATNGYLSSELPEEDLRRAVNESNPGPADESRTARIESLRAYLLQRATLNKEMEQAEGKLKGANERLEGLKNEDGLAWADLGLSSFSKPADPSLVQAKLDELTAANVRREQLRGTMEATSQAVVAAERRVKEIEQRIERNRRAVELGVSLDKLRDAFGRGGIPRNYLLQVYAMLVESTQVNLGQWESDFQVELDTEGVFNLLFWRNADPAIKFDQDLLSGGQRIRLGISFVMAIQQLVIPDLNFLVLDEPSTHLDAAGTEALQHLIQTMSHSLKNSEAQVIIVDHEPLLERAFPKSIRLMAPGEDAAAAEIAG